MKIYLVLNVANEIDGRITAVKVEKAYKNIESAQAFMNSNKNSYVEDMKVENDVLKFMCERNVQEVVLED